MAFVQPPTPVTSSTGLTSVTLAFGSANTSGNCLLAFINWTNANGGPTNVTDSNGNTWGQVGSNPVTAGPGFTSRATISTTSPSLCEDLVQSTADSIAATATLSGFGHSVAFMVALETTSIAGMQWISA